MNDLACPAWTQEYNPATQPVKQGSGAACTLAGDASTTTEKARLAHDTEYRGPVGEAFRAPAHLSCTLTNVAPLRCAAVECSPHPVTSLLGEGPVRVRLVPMISCRDRPCDPVADAGVLPA